MEETEITDVVRAVLGGDSPQFSRLVREFGLPLRAFIHARVQNAADAEDSAAVSHELSFQAVQMGNFIEELVVPEKRDYEFQAVQSKVMAVFFRIVWKVKNSSLKRKQKNTRSSFRMLKPHAARSALILSPATPLR